MTGETIYAEGREGGPAVVHPGEGEPLPQPPGEAEAPAAPGAEEEVGSLAGRLPDFAEPFPGYLDKIADLYARGLTHRQIGFVVRRAGGTVCRDLKRVKGLWAAEEAADTREEARAAYVARLERIAAEAGDAWEAS